MILKDVKSIVDVSKQNIKKKVEGIREKVKNNRK